MIQCIVFAFVWLALGVIGLLSGNEALLAIGIVSSAVNSVGVNVITEIRKQKENN